MSEFSLESRKITLSAGWDVIVVGGGPAGCAAATAAAREGARTLLMEGTGMLGGMGTAGLVPWFCGYGDGQKVIARGLAGHVRVAMARQMPHLREPMEQNPLVTPAIDPEVLKRVYDDMVMDSGAELMFHSLLCGVEKADERNVDVILVAGKSGLTAYKARVFIDCTGDGDLAAGSGAAFEKGDEKGALQPATHCFVIGNIDEEKLAQGPRIHAYDPQSPMRQAIRSEKYPLIDDLHACNIKIGPGTYGFNTGHIYNVDNTCPESVSRALPKGRRMAAQHRNAFAEYLPAFADSVLLATGSLMGIRETRRVIGDYVLSGEDYMERRGFHDEVCRNAYGIDVHESMSETQRRALVDLSVDALRERNRGIVSNMRSGESFGVPYRCLTPKGLDNVLVGGRCISTDRRANGSVRIMACCLNTGEAAGVAAALGNASAEINVHELDTRELRRILKDRGAFLP